MTRALPSQPSPHFLTNAMFFGEVQTDTTPAARTPKKSRSSNDIDIKKVKLNRRSRPTYSKMIEDAVFENREKRKGTSLAIIKKHLQQKYGVDVKKSAKRICKCIRESVGNGGHLKQMTGFGANGSFTLEKSVLKKLKLEREKSLIFKKALNQAVKDKDKKIPKPDTPVTRMRVK